MLIIDSKPGQLANRLFHFSYFIANSLQYHYKLINPGFEEYADLFISDEKSKKYFGKKNIRIKYHRNAFINKLYSQISEKIKAKAKRNKGHYLIAEISDIKSSCDSVYKEFDMNNSLFIHKAKVKLVFAAGWNYRDHENLKKYELSVKKIFAPAEKYEKSIFKIMDMLRAKADIVIGVHIRRGDYKEFFGGRWFYGDDVYYQKLKSIDLQIKNSGKICTFFICSNEVINPDNFRDLDLHFETREAIVDLYGLAACDFIIGPPSTFTMWASFYGNKPLHIIKNINEKIYLNEFKIAHGVETFF